MKATATALAAAATVLAKAALLAQDTSATGLPTGDLRVPEDDGLPWTYIVLVLLLIGVFFLLRRTRKPLPSKRPPRR